MPAYATRGARLDGRPASAAPQSAAAKREQIFESLISHLADRVTAAVVARLGTSDAVPEAEWFDSRHAADYVGVHRDTLRKLAAERAIPSEQDGPAASSTPALGSRRLARRRWPSAPPRPLLPSALLSLAVGERDNAPRRERVERNVYRRGSGVYEVGYKDATGKQRWRTVEGGITAARALRDRLLARRARGERVAGHGRLRLGHAAERWLGGPVLDLRPATQGCYRNAVEQHLLGRFETRRLDAITPDDLADVVRELRSQGLAESTIVIVLGVTNRIYRYAARRLGWVGTNPVSLMLSSERPKASRGKRRRIFEGAELEQTIAAADEPYRTLFTVAALTGARLSELLGLTWDRVRIDDLEDAELEFAFQVDRRGQLSPAKTDGSARTVPIPVQLAQILAGHKRRSAFTSPADFVFSTRTGKAFSQRNIGRALCGAQTRATTPSGEPTFSGSPCRRRGRRTSTCSARRDPVDAQLPSHGREPRLARGREHRRGRLPARAP